MGSSCPIARLVCPSSFRRIAATTSATFSHRPRGTVGIHDDNIAGSTLGAPVRYVPFAFGAVPSVRRGVSRKAVYPRVGRRLASRRRSSIIHNHRTVLALVPTNGIRGYRIVLARVQSVFFSRKRRVRYSLRAIIFGYVRHCRCSPLPRSPALPPRLCARPDRNSVFHCSIVTTYYYRCIYYAIILHL